MSSNKYLYRKVYQDLREQIISRTLLPGDKLPAESELSQTYQVSSITVKRALSMLQEDGLVKRVQGKGTFVRDLLQPAEQPLPQSPLPAAQLLQPAGKRGLVGLILEHVTSAFGLDMLYELTARLDEAGYQLIVRFSFSDIEKETALIGELLDMGAAGLLIMPCHDSYYSRTILRLILEDFPVVLIDKRMEGLPVSTVCTDGFEATRGLVRHLKECGCQTVAALTVNPSSSSSLGDRMSGFRRGVEESGLTCCGECVVPWRTGRMLSTVSEESYIETIRQFLTEHRVDGIVCTEYALARALYTVAGQLGIALGRELRACCIDEDALATTGYFFTHMKQDEWAIGRKAAELILQLLGGKKLPQQNIRVPAVFHQGQTT